ncbi:MAG TPA: O-antigen ligase family protein, partial [bacterium]
MDRFFCVRTLMIAKRISILFIAFALPLCFSIRLEDGFELAQSVALLWILAFIALLLVGTSWELNHIQNRFMFVCFGLFWLLGFYSFLHLREETYFYLPTQNYLWVLGAVLLMVPVVREMDKTRLYIFLVLSGVMGAFYSFAQALNLDLPGWSTNFAGRSFSTLGNPIFWAGYLLVVLPLALYLAGTTPRGWKRVFAVFAVLVLMVSLVTTQTRGAWLGFGFEVVVLVFFLGRKNPAFKYLMAGLLLFGMVLMVNPSLRQRVLSTLAVQSEDAKGRYFLWKVAEQQWESHKWLGQGPGG